jgi:acid stress-induced BolA-like protein IbaG/YrbA
MRRTEDFRFTDIIWHEAGMRPTDISNYIEDTLNKSLKIKDYGDIFDYIFFAFIIHLPIQVIHKEFRRISRKKRQVIVYAKIDYEKFMLANDQDALIMLCETFLTEIQQFTKRKDKDFDWRKFYEDAKKVIRNIENEKFEIRA